MSKKKILFMMSGSIACFKAISVLSELHKLGHEVEVVVSSSVYQFIGHATLQGFITGKVHDDQFAKNQAYDHINLERWADLIVLCPASANRLNMMAAGIAEDLMGTLCLAHEFKKPFIIFPAMNVSMLKHPATQNSMKTLTSWGIKIQETSTGKLACLEEGEGRLLEPTEILKVIKNYC
jgi:phosphopantothenoylcysteine decarboxylase/phosphopantothenate--cysteine ligase